MIKKTLFVFYCVVLYELSQATNLNGNNGYQNADGMKGSRFLQSLGINLMPEYETHPYITQGQSPLDNILYSLFGTGIQNPRDVYGFPSFTFPAINNQWNSYPQFQSDIHSFYPQSFYPDFPQQIPYQNSIFSGNLIRPQSPWNLWNQYYRPQNYGPIDLISLRRNKNQRNLN